MDIIIGELILISTEINAKKEYDEEKILKMEEILINLEKLILQDKIEYLKEKKDLLIIAYKDLKKYLHPIFEVKNLLCEKNSFLLANCFLLRLKNIFWKMNFFIILLYEKIKDFVSLKYFNSKNNLIKQFKNSTFLIFYLSLEKNKKLKKISWNVFTQQIHIFNIFLKFIEIENENLIFNEKDKKFYSQKKETQNNIYMMNKKIGIDDEILEKKINSENNAILNFYFLLLENVLPQNLLLDNSKEEILYLIEKNNLTFYLERFLILFINENQKNTTNILKFIFFILDFSLKYPEIEFFFFSPFDKKEEFSNKAIFSIFLVFIILLFSKVNKFAKSCIYLTTNILYQISNEVFQNKTKDYSNNLETSSKNCEWLSCKNSQFFLIKIFELQNHILCENNIEKKSIARLRRMLILLKKKFFYENSQENVIEEDNNLSNKLFDIYLNIFGQNEKQINENFSLKLKKFKLKLDNIFFSLNENFLNNSDVIQFISILEEEIFDTKISILYCLLIFDFSFLLINDLKIKMNEKSVIEKMKTFYDDLLPKFSQILSKRTKTLICETIESESLTVVIFENFSFSYCEKYLNYIFLSKKKETISALTEIFLRLIFIQNFKAILNPKKEVKETLISIFFKAFSFCNNKELNLLCEINEKSFWFFLILLNTYKSNKKENSDYLLFINDCLVNISQDSPFYLYKKILEILVKIVEEIIGDNLIEEFINILELFDRQKEICFFVFEFFLEDKIVFYLVSFFKMLELNIKNKIFLNFGQILKLVEILSCLICKYFDSFLLYKNIFFIHFDFLENVLILIENFCIFLLKKRYFFPDINLKERFGVLKIIFYNLSIKEKENLENDTNKENLQNSNNKNNNEIEFQIILEEIENLINIKSKSKNLKKGNVKISLYNRLILSKISLIFAILETIKNEEQHQMKFENLKEIKIYMENINAKNLLENNNNAIYSILLNSFNKIKKKIILNHLCLFLKYIEKKKLYHFINSSVVANIRNILLQITFENKEIINKEVISSKKISLSNMNKNENKIHSFKLANEIDFNANLQEFSGLEYDSKIESEKSNLKQFSKEENKIKNNNKNYKEIRDYLFCCYTILENKKNNLFDFDDILNRYSQDMNFILNLSKLSFEMGLNEIHLNILRKIVFVENLQNDKRLKKDLIPIFIKLIKSSHSEQEFCVYLKIIFRTFTNDKNFLFVVDSYLLASLFYNVFYFIKNFCLEKNELFQKFYKFYEECKTFEIFDSKIIGFIECSFGDLNIS